MHYVKKNKLLLAPLPEILANSNENYRSYNFQAFVNISENFRKFSKILNFRKIYNPTADCRCCLLSVAAFSCFSVLPLAHCLLCADLRLIQTRQQSLRIQAQCLR